MDNSSLPPILVEKPISDINVAFSKKEINKDIFSFVEKEASLLKGNYEKIIVSPILT